ncbi:exosortase family protein XrtF [Fulvivirga imtechensis]|uniref:exosortase family protein XrtF n=1 Tax=Fulvivirga imtechensis TaxID=881893 RepID=UPI0006885F9C|nr:exosortase family protein XrtF [Fulvivirga imtechensis]
MSLIREFKPTILFLVKFLGFYLILNLLYGFFIDAYSPLPDPVTRWVSVQSTSILNLFQYRIEYADHQYQPSINLILDGQDVILSIFEGCNGLNVIIIFVSFLLSFGKLSPRLIWFIPLGLIIIHIFNVLRILLLFLISVHWPDAMYFAHKYLFTAILYVVIFVLWYFWLNKLYVIKNT